MLIDLLVTYDRDFWLKEGRWPDYVPQWMWSWKRLTHTGRYG